MDEKFHKEARQVVDHNIHNYIDNAALWFVDIIKPQPPADREQRESDCDGNNPKRHGCEEHMRSAPKDRPSRPDGEDYKNLGGDRIHEPACPKQRFASAEQMPFDGIDVPFHCPGDSIFIDSCTE